MCGARGEWDTVSSLCEAVVLAKEEAERVRERSSSRPSRRRRHSGCRGSRNDLRPPLRACGRHAREANQRARPPRWG
ncbi:hypothetical protein SFRURICE_011023 [Spodoptera frugiperda]|nr:hypothetical protein SFRURICE_011023 [Spodoptera frugiperda]